EFFRDPEVFELLEKQAIPKLFEGKTSDQSLRVSDLTHHLADSDVLRDDAREVLSRLVPVEREVRGERGRGYLLRTLPYRTSEDRIEGVVLTLIEITSRKRAEDALRESEERFRSLVGTSAMLVWQTDARGEARDDSPSWRAQTG